jgi:hypothetical protein
MLSLFVWHKVWGSEECFVASMINLAPLDSKYLNIYKEYLKFKKVKKRRCMWYQIFVTSKIKGLPVLTKRMGCLTDFATSSSSLRGKSHPSRTIPSLKRGSLERVNSVVAPPNECPRQTRPILDRFQDNSRTGSGICFKKFFSDD